MSREADFDMDLFAEMIRSGARPRHGRVHVIRGVRTAAPPPEELSNDEEKL